jgi:hypothetical protein
MGNSVMFKISVSNEDAQEFADKFQNQSKSRIRQGLALIRQEWQQEFRRQDARMQREWTPLKTWTASTKPSRIRGNKVVVTGNDPKSYAERKKRAYYRGKSSGGKVKYLRILKRTGVMLERYISGISINNSTMTVSIPFPRGKVGVRAMSHQGYNSRGEAVGLPFGVLAHRPYDISRFEMVANRVLRREMYRD